MTITAHRASIDVEAVISEAVDLLVGAFDLDRIVLFGSRARGDARPDSDLDVLVVVPNGTDIRRARKQIDSLFIDLEELVILDVLVATPDMIEHRGRARTSVLRAALEEGTVLYERDPPSPALAHAIAEIMRERPLVNGVNPADVECALELWQKATADLHRAKRCLADVPVDADGACSNAQQCVEKVFKAAYAHDGIMYERTHSLRWLQADLPAGWPRPASTDDLKDLAGWWIYARYPGGPDPTADDAASAVALAQQVYDDMAAAFRQRSVDVPLGD